MEGKGKVYGIDLGTTYSAIATLDDNALPQIIESPVEGPLLASAVYFPEESDPVVGSEAKAQSEIEPGRVVQFVKREIGKPNPQEYEFDGEKYNPITISSLILKHIAQYAEEQGHKVEKVVITCPAYFGTEERNATRQAGVIAGFSEIDIVNEPTAAALNYCSRTYKEDRKIMVYDLGGGTFDITLFDYSVGEDGKASIDVIKTGGDDRLGGIDWDGRLFEYISKKYCDEFGIDIGDMDPELRQIIRSQAEETKKKLTQLPKHNVTINYDGDSTRITVTRDDFENQTSYLVERTLGFVTSLLEGAGITDKKDVDVVLLVGGSTKMPMIRKAVESFFPDSNVLVEQPDMAVAKGAALAAAIGYNEKVREFAKKVEKIVEAGGDKEEIRKLADEYESVAQEVIEKIESGEAATVADIVKAAETMTADDALMNVPATMSGSDVIKDKLNKSYGIRTQHKNEGLVISNIIFFEDPSPSEATRTYYTIVENQRSVAIVVYENVSIDRKKNIIKPENEDYINAKRDEKNEAFANAFHYSLMVKCIGEVTLPLPPDTPEDSPIEVTLTSNTGGLFVKARNPETNDVIEAEMISANTMSQKELKEAKERFADVITSGQI